MSQSSWAATGPRASGEARYRGGYSMLEGGWRSVARRPDSLFRSTGPYGAKNSCPTYQQLVAGAELEGVTMKQRNRHGQWQLVVYGEDKAQIYKYVDQYYDYLAKHVEGFNIDEVTISNDIWEDFHEHWRHRTEPAPSSQPSSSSGPVQEPSSSSGPVQVPAAMPPLTTSRAVIQLCTFGWQSIGRRTQARRTPLADWVKLPVKDEPPLATVRNVMEQAFGNAGTFDLVLCCTDMIDPEVDRSTKKKLKHHLGFAPLNRKHLWDTHGAKVRGHLSRLAELVQQSQQDGQPKRVGIYCKASRHRAPSVFCFLKDALTRGARVVELVEPEHMCDFWWRKVKCQRARVPCPECNFWHMGVAADAHAEALAFFNQEVKQQ